MDKENPRYMISTGWWCSDDDTRLAHHQGDARIRSVDFHHTWYRLVDRFTSPSRILIVDSASPVLPPVNSDDERIHVHSLAINAGHATNSQTQFCGWSASVLCGLQDCLHSDNDYFVYIEQDVLLYGEGIVETAISQMKSPYMFGDAKGIPQPLQQSFFIIRRDGIAPFLSRLLGIKESDRDLSPERKFHYACLPHLFTNKPLRWLGRRWRSYDYLPFGFGRKRPLDFSQPHFYFQHSSAEEFREFTELLKQNYKIDIL
jgi:hypothetical protein